MGSHNDRSALYQCKATLQNQIPDPLNGGTIKVDRDDALVLLTINSAGQTRLISAASASPVGTRLTILANSVTGGGTCTVQGVSFNASGQFATFVVMSIGGVNVWVGDAGSTAPSGTDGVAQNFAGMTGAATSGTTGKAGGNLSLSAGNGGADIAATAAGGAGGSLILSAGTGGSGSASGADGGVLVRTGSGRPLFTSQGTPTAKTTATTLTIAELLTGIITITHAAGANQNYGVPTAANVIAGLPPGATISDSFEWSVINLSGTPGTNTATITSADGNHTLVGSMVSSAENTSMRFKTRYSGAGTCVTYRLA